MAEKPLLDSNTAPKKLQQNWTGLKQGQRPQQMRTDTRRSYVSDSIALATAAIALHSCGMRASALCSTTSKPHSSGRDCLDTLLLNLRHGHFSRFGAKKHIDPTRSVARPWPRLRPPTLPLWSSCILHQKLANFDERGQKEVITAHGEQLNLVAVGLAAQQLVIKLVHDRHVHFMRDGAEGLSCASCRPKRFLIEGFGTTHTGVRRKEEGIQVAGRGDECERSGGGDRPSLNRFARGK